MTRYEQGFLTKCAEYGVPEYTAGAMLKQAVSTLGHELVGSVLTDSTSTLGGPAMLLGALNGGDLSDEELEDIIENRSNLSNYIPGVGAYRQGQRVNLLTRKIIERAKELHIKKVRPTRHVMTEDLSILNPLNWLGTPIGKLVGASRPHRTLDEQVLHDARKQSLKNLLIPGYGGYQSALRLGASRDVFEQNKKDRDKKDKDNENED